MPVSFENILTFLSSGALPYLVGKCGLNCDVYATVPVFQMGQMFAYDLYQSKHNYENFTLFTLDDVDSAFDRVTQVKYNQTITLQGRGEGMTITPLPAGHMLGGTIWKIVKDGGEDFVYAPDVNHKKERHLNGCSMDKISRPSLLITDCINANNVPDRRKKRDDILLASLLEVLRGTGNVMVCADTAGRMLELSLMLDQMWRADTGLQAYSICILNSFIYNIIEFAKSMIEWMSDKMARTFEGQRNNPFSFKHIQLVHNLDELSLLPEPRVVLCSPPDMESGFSRELFFDFATNERNMILITQRAPDGTLAAKLFSMANKEAKKSETIQVQRKMKIPLTGDELDEYIENKKLEAEERERLAREAKELESLKKEDGDDDDDDADSYENENFFGNQESMNEEEGKLGEHGASHHHHHHSAVIVKHDLMVSSLTTADTKSGGGSGSGSFFKTIKKSYPMYPYIEKRMRWDEYGELGGL